MTFHEFLAQIRTIRVEELRVQKEDYFEAVIFKAGLDPFREKLEAYFGAPFKPEGHAVSEKAALKALPYGGIHKEQTMYFRQDGDYSECALLWPWGGGTRITIKIARDKDSNSRASWLDSLVSIFDRKAKE